jgi:hypothetical protein
MVNYRVDDLEGLLEELRPFYVLVADRKIGVERNPDPHEQGTRK